MSLFKLLITGNLWFGNVAVVVIVNRFCSSEFCGIDSCSLFDSKFNKLDNIFDAFSEDLWSWSVIDRVWESNEENWFWLFVLLCLGMLWSLLEVWKNPETWGAPIIVLVEVGREEAVGVSRDWNNKLLFECNGVSSEIWIWEPRFATGVNCSEEHLFVCFGDNEEVEIECKFGSEVERFKEDEEYWDKKCFRWDKRREGGVVSVEGWGEECKWDKEDEDSEESSSVNCEE